MCWSEITIFLPWFWQRILVLLAAGVECTNGIHHLKDNQKSLGIIYDDKCIGTNRGFHNVDVDLFLPVDVPSPWD